MRIHAGTLGTLLREVGRSLSGHDRVFLPGKKTKKGPGRARAVLGGSRWIFPGLRGRKNDQKLSFTKFSNKMFSFSIF